LHKLTGQYLRYLKGGKVRVDQLELLKWADAVLHNDESSSDEQMVEAFISEGFTEEDAKRLVGQRTQCLNDMYYAAWVKIQ